MFKHLPLAYWDGVASRDDLWGGTHPRMQQFATSSGTHTILPTGIDVGAAAGGCAILGRASSLVANLLVWEAIRHHRIDRVEIWDLDEEFVGLRRWPGCTITRLHGGDPASVVQVGVPVWDIKVSVHIMIGQSAVPERILDDMLSSRELSSPGVSRLVVLSRTAMSLALKQGRKEFTHPGMHFVGLVSDQQPLQGWKPGMVVALPIDEASAVARDATKHLTQNQHTAFQHQWKACTNVKGYYVEAMIWRLDLAEALSTPWIKTRICLTPFGYWLITSHGADIRLLDQSRWREQAQLHPERAEELFIMANLALADRYATGVEGAADDLRQPVIDLIRLAMDQHRLTESMLSERLHHASNGLVHQVMTGAKKVPVDAMDQWANSLGLEGDVRDQFTDAVLLSHAHPALAQRFIELRYRGTAQTGRPIGYRGVNSE